MVIRLKERRGMNNNARIRSQVTRKRMISLPRPEHQSVGDFFSDDESTGVLWEAMKVVRFYPTSNRVSANNIKKNAGAIFGRKY